MTTLVKVDRLRAEDRPALAALFARCSPASVVSRFFAPVRAIPRSYVDSALAGPPARHDALVLRYGDGLHVAGLASLVADRDTAVPAAELGVLVQDGWQGRGYGSALVAALLERAAERGVEEVVAAVLPGRFGLLAALNRRLEPVSITAEEDYLTARYRIPAEVDREHP